MLKIKRIDRVKNEKVLQKLRRNNLINILYKHQHRSFQHWIRKYDITTRFALYINNNKINPQGRPMLLTPFRMCLFRVVHGLEGKKAPYG